MVSVQFVPKMLSINPELFRRKISDYVCPALFLNKLSIGQKFIQ